MTDTPTAVVHIKGQPWTEAQVRAEAAKYKTRAEFYAGSYGAYEKARRIGILDDLFVRARVSWDLEALKSEVAKFGTKEAFRRGCAGGHSYASKHGLMNTLFPDARPYRRWNEASVRLEAEKYPSKKAFKNGCESAYSIAVEMGIIDDLFENQHITWTEKLVRVEAKKYNTKFEFQQGCQPAYVWARRNGILNDLGFKPGASTFLFERPSLLYIVDTVLTDGSEGIMFGITNRRSPTMRYHKVDRSLMANRIAYRFPTGADAHAVESRLKREFKDYHITEGLSPFKGCPESRRKKGSNGKKGTSGEIIYSTAGRENIEALVRGHACGEPFAW